MYKDNSAGSVPAVVFCILVACAFNAHAQIQSSPTQKKTDSTFAERVVRRDSSTPPLAGFYSIDTPDSLLSPASLTKHDRRNVRYHSLGELLARGTYYMPLSHGGFGQHDAISILGGSNADLAVSLNGRPVASLWSAQMPLSHVAPEGLESVQILTGAHSIGLGASMSLSSINLREIQHNTATPYTSMWYSQGGGDVIAADVSFSQNVADGVNVTFGVRRSGAFGRYTNTEFDVWNLRAGVRYSMDTLNQIGVSYVLTSHNTGLWGGLRTHLPLNQFTERTAPAVFFNLKDETRRHDLTATYQHAFDVNARNAFSVQVYATMDDMLRLRDSTLYTSSSDTNSHMVFHGRQAGALLRGTFSLDDLILNVGAGADLVTNDSTVYAEEFNEVRPQAFGHLAIPLINSFKLFTSGRITLINDRVLTAAGAALEWSGGTSSVTLDVSSAQRASSAAEGLSLNPERASVASITARMKGSDVQFEGEAFYRMVTDPLVTTAQRDSLQFIQSTRTSNGNAYSFGGITAMAVIRAFAPPLHATEQGVSSQWWIELRPVIRAFFERNATDSTRTFPLLFGELTAAFVYRTGSNTVKLGLTGSAVSPMASRQYIPTTWTYAQPTSPLDWSVNGLDVFLLANLGNASVRLAYENFLAQRWQTTAIAPYIIRDIRLSVTWSFFD